MANADVSTAASVGIARSKAECITSGTSARKRMRGANTTSAKRGSR